MPNFAFETLAVPGPMLIRPRRFGDARGYFMETYSLDVFRNAGIGMAFVQDNQSLSEKRGALCGLHFQKPPGGAGQAGARAHGRDRRRRGRSA